MVPSVFLVDTVQRGERGLIICLHVLSLMPTTHLQVFGALATKTCRCWFSFLFIFGKHSGKILANHLWNLAVVPENSVAPECFLESCRILIKKILNFLPISSTVRHLDWCLPRELGQCNVGRFVCLFDIHRLPTKDTSFWVSTNILVSIFFNLPQRPAKAPLVPAQPHAGRAV